MQDVAKAYKEEQRAKAGSENELPALFFYYEGSAPEVGFHLAYVTVKHTQLMLDK